MTRWHDLLPTDDTVFASAPVRTRQVLDTTAPVADLWSALEADDAVAAWSRLVTRSRWPRPHGVGSVREVTVGGIVTVREHFHRWEENERMTFTVLQASRPGIRRFAEDYVLSPTPGGSRLVWTVAMEPVGLPTAAKGVASAGLGLAVGRLVSGLRSRLRD